MDYYKGLHIVHHPSGNGLFLIGVDAVVSFLSYLQNGRFIAERKLGFYHRMNPWGYKGETLEEIIRFFRGVSSKYDYTQEQGFFPLYIADKGIGWKGRISYPEQQFLKKEDVLHDLKLKIHTPITLDPDTKFRDSTFINFPWVDISRCMEDYFPESGFISQELIQDNETTGYLKPYYVIQIKNYKGWNVYISGVKNGSVNSVFYPKIAKQFDKEEDALSYIISRSDIHSVGFEIKEIPPPTEIGCIYWT